MTDLTQPGTMVIWSLPHTASFPGAGATLGRWWARLWRWLHAAQLNQQDSTPVSHGNSVAPATAPVAGSASFADFFARYHAPLIEYLYGMTRNRELAADLVQDTFVKAYADAPDLASIHFPRAWLYTIATRLALNAARHTALLEWLPLNRVEREAADDAIDGAWAALPPVTFALQADDPAATISERDAIWSVLAELPARWRAVLLLQASAGFEVREIATQLALSEANVRKILARAKLRFRDRYLQLAEKGA